MKFKPNVIVQGPMLPEPVKIATIQELGDTLKLIGEGLHTGKFHSPSLSLTNLTSLRLSLKPRMTAIRSSFD
ncbi:MAG: hypothetical protein GY801_10460 [bacterium]|nr:hypothetical protein [bacterium]